MAYWIGDFDVLQATIKDLVVIIWVAPGSKTIETGAGEEVTVSKVRI